MKQYTVLTINPGSTSMKIGLYRDMEELFSKNLEIPNERLAEFPTLYDQYLYRKQMVVDEFAAHGYSLKEVDVYLARAGGMVACESGVYAVNDKLMEMNNLKMEQASAQQMGCQFVTDFTAEYGGKGYVINDSSVDEFIDVARVTGLKGVWRSTVAHSLNQKIVGELATKKLNGNYGDMNLIIAHLGGGISIGAHRKGKMIDTTNLFGEGPLTPTRTGGVPIGDLLLPVIYGKIPADKLLGKCIRHGGGLLDHLGTADGREVEARIANGDEYAKLIYDGMIYQISQSIGKMAVTLEGKTDYIIMTGGMSNSKYIQQGVKEYCQWIAPVEVLAGEYETEAMVTAALRVMRGEDSVKEYTGIPTFDPSRFQ